MTVGCGVVCAGFELLYQPEVVRLYLSLLTESRNFNTLEAAAGALQNLSAGNWMVRGQVWQGGDREGIPGVPVGACPCLCPYWGERRGHSASPPSGRFKTQGLQAVRPRWWWVGGGELLLAVELSCWGRASLEGQPCWREWSGLRWESIRRVRCDAAC